MYSNSPTFEGFTVGISGTRFSMTAGRRINGDFVNSNDITYLFFNITASLLTDLGVVKSLKNYISEYNGKIPERNGGVNSFYGVWHIRIAKKLKFEKVENLEFSVDIFNIANILNKKWGE